jgi:threonine dehydratase
MITREAITRAAHRIAPHVRRTPVLDVGVEGVDHPVTLKLELLQHAGSFKSRGAFNTLLQARVGPGGVATASGGNHGAAVAYAAQQLGYRARIFVPEISSPAKVARIASYGAEIVQKGANYNEALTLCEAHIAETGATGVHAYDAEATLEGQGTLARELEDQAPGSIRCSSPWAAAASSAASRRGISRASRSWVWSPSPATRFMPPGRGRARAGEDLGPCRGFTRCHDMSES